MPRYRFREFTVSSRQRLLLQGDRELRLIPRYLDLLLFLIEHRHEAVHRRDIFDHVWTDVVVSDSALAQAIRTLRRTLGDDSRDPIFIRTISRHGYQFVFSDVVEEPDEGRPALVAPVPPPTTPTTDDDLELLLQRISTEPGSAVEEEEQREAAERLHALGTANALARLGTRMGHAYARAVLRDTRWDVPESGDVPLVGQPRALETAMALVRLRLRRVLRIAASRCFAAALGGGLAGACAGAIGGVLLSAAPDSRAPLAIAGVLALIGSVCGAWGAAAVGLGTSVAEAAARSYRAVAIVAGAAFGGGVAGALAQWVSTAALGAIVGVHVAIGGPFEGAVLGGAAGVGLAVATRYAQAGFAAPRGRRRLVAVLLTASTCALAALALALSGASLVGGTIHDIAQASVGSEATLTPLSHLLGEPEFGPWSRALLGMGEGAMFGLGIAAGLTHRPAARTA